MRNRKSSFADDARRRTEGKKTNALLRRHGRVARDGHGLLKVSLGPAMPNPSTPCGRSTPETAVFQPLGHPHAVRLCAPHSTTRSQETRFIRGEWQTAIWIIIKCEMPARNSNGGRVGDQQFTSLYQQDLHIRRNITQTYWTLSLTCKNRATCRMTTPTVKIFLLQYNINPTNVIQYFSFYFWKDECKGCTWWIGDRDVLLVHKYNNSFIEE
jgi:hypothetical protein